MSKSLSRPRPAAVGRWAIASELAASDPAPPRPSARGPQVQAPLPYVLPAQAPVTNGLGSVDANGVRSRGLTLDTGRGAQLIVPASGIVRFRGPFRSHDGVVIIDHGGGWMSLIVNVASPLKPGDRFVSATPSEGLSEGSKWNCPQNGRRVSPALIAGSSRTLSNGREGG
jgi:septal ring factor EnvC (AmiA/AmiB activator)